MSLAKDKQNLCNTALELADRGWFVFPCYFERDKDGNKVNNRWDHKWRDVSTDDRDKVEAFNWEKYSNVGIDMGKSGLAAFDVDDLKVYKQISFPPTLVHKTLKGYHHIYKAPKVKPKNTNSHYIEKLDIKADGGLLYYHDMGDNGEDIADWPTEVMQQIEDIRKTTAKKAPLSNVLDFTIKEGNRNESLYRAGCGKVAQNWNYADVLSWARGENLGYSPPMDDTEVIAIVSQAFKHLSNDEKEQQEQIEVDNKLRKLYEDGFYNDIGDFPDVPRPEAFCGDWLFDKSLYLIHSRAGAGKTAVVGDLIYNLKEGTEFLGMPTAAPKKVLFVNGDMSDWLVTERFKFLKDKMAFLHMRYQDLLVSPALLLEYCAGFDLIVFDNRGCLFELTDVNDPNCWKPLIDILRKLAEQSCVILITHAGKGENSSSFGSSAQEWFVDGTLSITHNHDSGVRKLVFEKERVGGNAPIEFYLEKEGDRLKAVKGKDPADAVIDGLSPTTPIMAQIVNHIYQAQLTGKPITWTEMKGLFRLNGVIDIPEKKGVAILGQLIEEGAIYKNGSKLFKKV